MISLELKRFELYPSVPKHQTDAQIIKDFIERGFLLINSQPDKRKYGPFLKNGIGAESYQHLHGNLRNFLDELLNDLAQSDYLDSSGNELVNRFIRLYTEFYDNKNARAYQPNPESTNEAIASGIGFSYFHSFIVLADTSMDLITIWWD
jgi:hypothetical protein